MVLCFRVLLICLVLSGCYSNRHLVYLQDKSLSSTPSSFENTAPVYRVQANDVLFVQVLGQNEEDTKIFNTRAQTGGGGVVNEALVFIQGSPVSPEGAISIPSLGVFQVAGLTLEEVRQLVSKAVSKTNREGTFTVVVRLMSFRISVLGEVDNPGTYHIYHNQVSIFQALALAGDLTDQANRKRIKLLRQKPGGGDIVLLDITDPDIVKSPYFYLQPNDQLYVEPRRIKSRRLNLPVLTTTFAGLSTFVLVLRYFETR